ncbi:restriction endonuclease subunit S [Hanstruepera ponticola]|uniref:restriction endonuclease subunit S n=1 Tax=Hanstruepera ponticola TaxID=2042995 RepID=UPI001780E064|nr:restriction endonuclease subunit S [Hanstruepera ponticola]
MKHLLQHFKTLTKQPQNASALKGFILQLAVRGKLTANWRLKNPNVEPTSKKLAEIENHTALSKIESDEIPFTLDKTWNWCRFIDVASLRHGYQFRKHDFVEEGIPVVKIGQCKADGTLDFSKCNFIDSNRKNEFEHVLIFKGHLLMALTGGTLGKVTRVDKDYGVVVQNYRVGNFFANENILFLDFLNVILESDLFQGLVRERINQNAQPNIGKDNIEKIVMPIPPLEEQKAIVAIVNELFKEVEQLEEQTKTRIQLKEDFVTSALQRLAQTENVNQEWQFLHTRFTEFFTEKENVKQLRETILQLAIQGKLTSKWRSQNLKIVSVSRKLANIEKEKGLSKIDPSEIPFELVETWEWCRFIDVASLRHGYQFRKHDFVEEGIPVVKIGQCKADGTLDFSKCNFIDSSREEEFEHVLIYKGHLLMALTGGTLGKVTRVDKDYGVVVQNYRVGNFFANEEILSIDFLNVILESELFQGLVRERINQNAQPNIGKDNIEKIVMPIPPLEEQKAIVKQVNSLMALCDSLEEHIENSQTQIEQLMQSCLREVFENN